MVKVLGKLVDEDLTYWNGLGLPNDRPDWLVTLLTQEIVDIKRDSTTDNAIQKFYERRATKEKKIISNDVLPLLTYIFKRFVPPLPSGTNLEEHIRAFFLALEYFNMSDKEYQKMHQQHKEDKDNTKEDQDDGENDSGRCSEVDDAYDEHVDEFDNKEDIHNKEDEPSSQPIIKGTQSRNFVPCCDLAISKGKATNSPALSKMPKPHALACLLLGPLGFQYEAFSTETQQEGHTMSRGKLNILKQQQQFTLGLTPESGLGTGKGKLQGGPASFIQSIAAKSEQKQEELLMILRQSVSAKSQGASITNLQQKLALLKEMDQDEVILKKIKTTQHALLAALEENEELLLQEKLAGQEKEKKSNEEKQRQEKEKRVEITPTKGKEKKGDTPPTKAAPSKARYLFKNLCLLAFKNLVIRFVMHPVVKRRQAKAKRPNKRRAVKAASLFFIRPLLLFDQDGFFFHLFTRC